MSSTAEKRTTNLELFVDLVFVFAITQIAAALHDDHTARGWWQFGLLAWLVWWAWSQLTWVGNAVDLDTRPRRVVILAVAGVTLMAAAAIPDAFTGRVWWFVVPYGAVRLGSLALYWVGLSGDREHRAALRTYVPVALVGPVFGVVGAALDPGPRRWVWTLAVAVDVVSALAGGRGEFRISPTHFAERHALIVIIALGESVVAVGATVSGQPRTAAVAVVLAAAVTVIACLWWSYFDWVGAAAEERLSRERDHRRRARLARDLFTFGHLPIVAGTVVFAVGVEEAVLHPREHLDAFGRLAIGGGIAGFLLGFVVGNARATGRWLVERTVAALATVAVVAALGAGVSATTLLLVVAGILVGTAAVETGRRRPAPRVV